MFLSALKGIEDVIFVTYGCSIDPYNWICPSY